MFLSLREAASPPLNLLQAVPPASPTTPLMDIELEEEEDYELAAESS